MRRYGRQRTRASPLSVSTIGSTTVPRSVPNIRVVTATGTAICPSRGGPARPARTASTVAWRSTAVYVATKRSGG